MSDVYLSRRSDRDARLSSAFVCLCGHDHVVVSSETHASIGPSVEEVACSDSSTCPFRSANSPILIESLGSVDGWRVGACSLIQVVCTSCEKDVFSREAQMRSNIAIDLKLKEVICDCKFLAFLPSDVTVPFDAAPEEGLYSPKFSRM